MIFADTHVLVWLGQGSLRLPHTARERMLDTGFVVSSVTAWEYSDLLGRGRLPDGVPLDPLLAEFVCPTIAFPAEAAAVAASLPWIHGDPVDRMLIGHTLVAGGLLATADSQMRRYAVPLLW